VVNARRVVNEGRLPDWTALGAVTAVSGVVAVMGYMWFMKLKRAFADVI
jgi:lipopolysaccharide transport system permease protein